MRIVIKKAIKDSRYFIPRFASESVDKIGYVHKESRHGDLKENMIRVWREKIKFFGRW